MNAKHDIAIAIAILILVIQLLFIAFGDRGLADLNNLKQHRDKLIAENKRLVQENSVLKRMVKRLREKDSALIEKLAREELHMVGKDEMILLPDKRTRR